MSRVYVLSLALAGLLSIAGCTTAPVQSMSLAENSVVATSPKGYCIDTAASRAADGFAVMAPCATLGTTDALPYAVGVATIQVGPPDSGSVAGGEIALRDLLDSDAGANLLSGDGDASTVTILSSGTGTNAVRIHFTDTAPPPMAGLQPQEWRAFTDINNRLVTVAVRGLASAPLPDGVGTWLLDRVLGGLGSSETDTATPAT